MKTTKISSLIKKRRYLAIHTSGNEQWISDGVAAYPVQGMPVMSDSQMLKHLDLQPKDKVEVINWEADKIETKDSIAEETAIEEFGPSLLINGEEYASLYTEIGLLLINEKYLVPVHTDTSDGALSFWLRHNNGYPLIAVKKGLFLLALIYPLKTWGSYDTLENSYNRLLRELQKVNRRMSKEE